MLLWMYIIVLLLVISSKAKHKAPSNLQSLACALPQALPVMVLVAHDPRHVSSYVWYVQERCFHWRWNEYRFNNLRWILVKGMEVIPVKVRSRRRRGRLFHARDSCSHLRGPFLEARFDVANISSWFLTCKDRPCFLNVLVFDVCVPLYV